MNLIYKENLKTKNGSYTGYVIENSEIRQGKGKMIYEHNEGLYEGFWDKNKKNGNGILINYKENYKYTGGFLNNNTHGEGVFIDQNNNYTYSGTWKNNILITFKELKKIYNDTYHYLTNEKYKFTENLQIDIVKNLHYMFEITKIFSIGKYLDSILKKIIKKGFGKENTNLNNNQKIKILKRKINDNIDYFSLILNTQFIDFLTEELSYLTKKCDQSLTFKNYFISAHGNLIPQEIFILPDNICLEFVAKAGTIAVSQIKNENNKFESKIDIGPLGLNRTIYIGQIVQNMSIIFDPTFSNTNNTNDLTLSKQGFLDNNKYILDAQNPIEEKDFLIKSDFADLVDN